MCVHHFPVANVTVPLSLTSPRAAHPPPPRPRRHAASTREEGASKLRNPPPAGRLEFTPQAGQPNGNKKLRQTALPTPRRPGNIAPTTPGFKGVRGPSVDGAGRRAISSLLGGFSKRRLGGYLGGLTSRVGQGSPRVALSDANCLYSNCLRVTSLKQSSNCSISGGTHSIETAVKIAL